MLRAKPLEEELEDITGSAGWMYTDLFVGLMVIFLATISFIPKDRQYIDKTAVQTYTQIYQTPLAIRYNSFNYPQVNRDINAFLTKNGIQGAAQVAHLTIVGSYNKNTESSDAGIQRAIAINTALNTNDSTLLSHGTTSYAAFADTNVNNFVLQFTFQVQVQVLKNTAKTP